MKELCRFYTSSGLTVCPSSPLALFYFLDEILCIGSCIKSITDDICGYLTMTPSQVSELLVVSAGCRKGEVSKEGSSMHKDEGDQSHRVSR